MANRKGMTGKSIIGGVGGAVLTGMALLIWSVTGRSDESWCSLDPTRKRPRVGEDYTPTSTQLRALLHYATSPHIPQQSLAEITLTFRVLKSMARPSNILVFGLGHDSLMWDSFNSGGTTLFLEEDPKWVQMVLKDAPGLRAHTLQYHTPLRQAGPLLSSYRSEPACSPSLPYLRGNHRCKLALSNLPDEVYDQDWDLIIIDTPGRMAAIFSAAVMARTRRASGATHIVLHDVDREAVKVYAYEFLCSYNLVNAVGKLWHFQIPPNLAHHPPPSRFC
ncbi:probable methyltransferase At1g27930 [Neltuma alba]|uniref:probable methyltransferase At1g27930 n=1 Tax=Neltuma alba TaxID=207710 RepID=UPI0010A3B960|nr:probable methyltransferase At1g27930 [Prosopis alba]